MDTAACQSIPAILTWLQNSLPAWHINLRLEERGEITGRVRRGKKEEGDGEEKYGRLRYDAINISGLLLVIKADSIYKSPDINQNKSSSFLCVFFSFCP